MVTDAQVKLLRQKLMEGKTQETSSAAAGMSVRSGRKWQSGPLPSESGQPRSWRTRPDPFAEVWEKHVLSWLLADKEGVLEATTVLSELERLYPGQFPAGQVRTLQRRIRDWRAVHGPEQEVYFEQEHVPGREGAFDFTHATELGVTIAGRLLEHLLFTFVLSYSGWVWIKVAFGETFEALVAGLQGALWALGGCPSVVRHDNLSAATHELRFTGGRSLNQRFAAVLAHYGLASTRIRPGESHENGVAEEANKRLKSLIEQALVLRGSRDFATLDEYEAFARDVAQRRVNTPTATLLAEERAVLRPLPTAAVPSFTTFHPTVRKWSTIRVGGRTYSVVSRLIGHEVVVRRHPDVIEVFYKGRLVECMPRLRGEKTARIDYRHIIWSLVRKPGAFARYRYREELFPSLVFRQAYDRLRQSRGDRADVEYVRILHLAASTMESVVERALGQLVEDGRAFDYVDVKALASPEKPNVPLIDIAPPDPASYDLLLAGGAR